MSNLNELLKLKKTQLLDVCVEKGIVCKYYWNKTNIANAIMNINVGGDQGQPVINNVRPTSHNQVDDGFKSVNQCNTIRKYKKGDIQEVARRMGLETSGTRRQICERIWRKQSGSAAIQNPPPPSSPPPPPSQDLEVPQQPQGTQEFKTGDRVIYNVDVPDGTNQRVDAIIINVENAGTSLEYYEVFAHGLNKISRVTPSSLMANPDPSSCNFATIAKLLRISDSGTESEICDRIKQTLVYGQIVPDISETMDGEPPVELVGEEEEEKEEYNLEEEKEEYNLEEEKEEYNLEEEEKEEYNLEDSIPADIPTRIMEEDSDNESVTEYIPEEIRDGDVIEYEPTKEVESLLFDMKEMSASTTTQIQSKILKCLGLI